MNKACNINFMASMETIGCTSPAYMIFGMINSFLNQGSDKYGQLLIENRTKYTNMIRKMCTTFDTCVASSVWCQWGELLRADPASAAESFGSSLQHERHTTSLEHDYLHQCQHILYSVWDSRSGKFTQLHQCVYTECIFTACFVWFFFRTYLYSDA